MYVITEGIAHRDVIDELTSYCCRIVELKMADADLNCALAFME